MLYLITYDIADDRRREDVATLLSGYGPRVQLSVFECDVRSRRRSWTCAASSGTSSTRWRIRCASIRWMNGCP